MQILLFDPNPQRRQRWQTRLQDPSSQLHVAASTLDAASAVAQNRFAICFVAQDAKSSSAENDTAETLRKLRLRCQWLVCLIDQWDDQDVHHAYASGFDDCLLSFCSDAELSSKLQQAERIERLNARLAQAQKLESIGELAAGIAHEINTPIQYVGDNTRFVQSACDDLADVLVGCQELLQAVDASEDLSKATTRLKNLLDAADVEYLMEEIPAAIVQTLEGVDRVANIVRAMKEFAHPGASEMTLTDLSKSIENTVMVARNEWKYVANVETVFDPDLAPVPCLPGEMNQVLLNIIVNAAHAIADSLGDSPQRKGTITITTKRLDCFAEIRISDTGSGIPAENLQRIFSPFFTTKAAGKGTGQGLAIAHSVIVEKHQGTIHAESSLHQGTTFVIRIPLELKCREAPPDACESEVSAPHQPLLSR